MNKEQQIEEIAKILCPDYGNGNGCQLSYNGSCDTCYSYDDAETIYAAGYRKQSEGEWKATCVCNIFQCTNCKKTTSFDEFCNGVFSPKAYCPNCGARMKGGEQE